LNRPSLVHQELGGPGDILAILPARGMQHAELADDLRFRIGEEIVSVPFAVAKLAGRFAGIDTDRGNPDSPRAKIREPPLETL